MFTKKNNLSNHSFFMNLALLQAKKNLGNTKENPSVGCVITKNESLLSVGCTSLNGRPHAEQNALIPGNRNFAGSKMYVTLEPCSHFGHTPPCTKAIIKRKLKKVFFSVHDPDVRSHKKCSTLFKENNIHVNHGINKKEIKSFYRSYFKSKLTPFPFVSCKLAISKDYFTISKDNKWITNSFSRSRAHLIRSNHDCIITTARTIIADNSKLTCRINGLSNRTPSRIILDKELKVPVKSKIIKDASKFDTIIFYNKIKTKKIKKLIKLKVKLYKLPVDIDGNLDLVKVLIKAKSLGFYRILIESGIKLISHFLSKDLIDDFILFVSKKKLGSRGKYRMPRYIKSIFKNKEKHHEKVNLFGDKLITYKIK